MTGNNIIQSRDNEKYQLYWVADMDYILLKNQVFLVPCNKTYSKNTSTT